LRGIFSRQGAKARREAKKTGIISATLQLLIQISHLLKLSGKTFNKLTSFFGEVS
jgi:hypothetical protein